MTLIGIALCGFLLLALVGTQAGRAILKVAGVLIGSVAAVMAIAVWINSAQPPASSGVASATQPDPICHDAKALAAAADEATGTLASLPRDERELFIGGDHHCPYAPPR